MNVIKIDDSRYLSDIMEVEKQSFSLPWSRGMFKDELSKDIAHYFGAIDEEKLIGYAGFWKILDEGHITNIAVSKAYRHQGIGKKLISAMMEYCKSDDITRMTLEVRQSNYDAISLYETMGFLVAGIRKGYYEDNKEAAIIMWCSL